MTSRGPFWPKTFHDSMILSPKCHALLIILSDNHPGLTIPCCSCNLTCHWHQAVPRKWIYEVVCGEKLTPGVHVDWLLPGTSHPHLQWPHPLSYSFPPQVTAFRALCTSFRWGLKCSSFLWGNLNLSGLYSLVTTKSQILNPVRGTQTTGKDATQAKRTLFQYIIL